MIQLIVLLIVVGVLLYLMETVLPLDNTIKRIIHVVVILCVLLYVLRFLGFV